jgi:crotonobetainyl-CoA:carnitine CoA-transferase CaiB-like acyl-CoA transferase
LKPLENVRVLDLSRLVAGGLPGMLMADFGAEVVKLEQPGVGDPLRKWTTEGLPLWWKVYARNKRFITLDLQCPEGKDIFRQLISRFDVLIESFIPGTLEKWSLGWDVLKCLHPGLILARISGWGQTGPKSGLPGFGTLVEAASGFAAMNGEASGPPIVPGFPLADMITGLYATNAIMLALYQRDVNKGEGQVVDVSLFESLFSVLGPLPAEYAGFGKIRLRQGSRSSNAGPRGIYQTSDGYWIAVSASTPITAERFLESYGLGAMLLDPQFADNESRVRHAARLDQIISDAIGGRTLDENLELINTNKLSAIQVQTIADIENDPQWKARQLLVDVADPEMGTVRMHNTLPLLSQTPGEIKWTGGGLGADNLAFYTDELGLSKEQVEQLQFKAVI